MSAPVNKTLSNIVQSSVYNRDFGCVGKLQSESSARVLQWKRRSAAARFRWGANNAYLNQHARFSIFQLGAQLEFDVNVNDDHPRGWLILITPRDQLRIGDGRNRA